MAMAKLDGLSVTEELLDAHDRVTSMTNQEFFDRARAIGHPIAHYDTGMHWNLGNRPTRWASETGSRREPFDGS